MSSGWWVTDAVQSSGLCESIMFCSLSRGDPERSESSPSDWMWKLAAIITKALINISAASAGLSLFFSFSLSFLRYIPVSTVFSSLNTFRIETHSKHLVCSLVTGMHSRTGSYAHTECLTAPEGWRTISQWPFLFYCEVFFALQSKINNISLMSSKHSWSFKERERRMHVCVYVSRQTV